LLLHRLGLSIAGCVEDDVIDALFATEAKLFLIPGDSLAFAAIPSTTEATHLH